MSNRSHTQRSLLHRIGAVAAARSRVSQGIGAPLPLVFIAALGTLAFVASPALAFKVHVYSSSFGGPCSTTPCGNGQFDEPLGVAVNSSTSSTEPAAGDVYVVDEGDDRVERFSPTGVYLGQFNGSGSYEVEGKKEAGTAAPTGTFSGPEWIAVDSDEASPSFGDVYVTDNGHKVVDKFSASGAYLGQITEGAGGAPLNELQGLAVDTGGVVWIDEAVAGTGGDERGEIDSYSNAPGNAFVSTRKDPFDYVNPGFAVDSEDNLYVVRAGPFGAELNSSGEVLDGQLGPRPPAGTALVAAIAVDPSTDNIYVDQQAMVAASKRLVKAPAWRYCPLCLRKSTTTQDMQLSNASARNSSPLAVPARSRFMPPAAPSRGTPEPCTPSTTPQTRSRCSTKSSNRR
jgi:hypothetical protein